MLKPKLFKQMGIICLLLFLKFNPINGNTEAVHPKSFPANDSKIIEQRLIATLNSQDINLEPSKSSELVNNGVQDKATKEDSPLLKQTVNNTVGESILSWKKSPEISKTKILAEMREKIVFQLRNRYSLAQINEIKKQSGLQRRLNRLRREERSESSFSFKQLKLDHFSKLSFGRKGSGNSSTMAEYCAGLKSESVSIEGRAAEKSFHCYQCQSTLSDAEPQCDNYLWKHLRHSEKFKLRIRCPSSEDPRCIKKIYKKFGERITERGCFMDKHLDRNETKENVQEGCVTYQDNGYLATICFCKDELCNRTSRLKYSSYLGIVFIIYNFLFNLFYERVYV